MHAIHPASERADTATGLAHEVARRRTFATISQTDAVKTTLTEKHLLYAGASELAGAVRTGKRGWHATADWLAIEQERGITVTSTSLQFDAHRCCFKLLDTPSHQDFPEDACRTLMVADGAELVLDAARHKQFHKGLAQLEDEGIIQVLFPSDGASREAILTAVREPQLDVVIARLRSEYGVTSSVERLPHVYARWIEGDPKRVARMVRSPHGSLRAEDQSGRPVVLFVSSGRWTPIRRRARV